MPKESKELRQQIVEDINETGLRIKSLILELLRKEVPVLPKYDQHSQGFQEAYDSCLTPELTQKERRSGIKLHTDWSSSGAMIVLERDGIFEIPMKIDEHSRLYPSFDDIREIQPTDYLIYAYQALEEICEWSEGRNQPQEASSSANKSE